MLVERIILIPARLPNERTEGWALYAETPDGQLKIIDAWDHGPFDRLDTVLHHVLRSLLAARLELL